MTDNECRCRNTDSISRGTPAALTDQLSQSVAGLADSVRDFAAEIKDAMAEREEELMAALADDGTGPPPGGNAR